MKGPPGQRSSGGKFCAEISQTEPQYARVQCAQCVQRFCVCVCVCMCFCTGPGLLTIDSYAFADRFPGPTRLKSIEHRGGERNVLQPHLPPLNTPVRFLALATTARNCKLLSPGVFLGCLARPGQKKFTGQFSVATAIILNLSASCCLMGGPPTLSTHTPTHSEGVLCCTFNSLVAVGWLVYRLNGETGVLQGNNRVTLMVVKGGALVHRGANVEGENSRPPFATWWCFSDARFVSFAVRFDSPVRLTGDERILYTSLQGSKVRE